MPGAWSPLECQGVILSDWEMRNIKGLEGGGGGMFLTFELLNEPKAKENTKKRGGG